MKKFFVLYPTVVLFLLSLLVYYNYDDRRIKETKGSILIYKNASNFRYSFQDENDIKAIISIINNSKKIKLTYMEVENVYKHKERYDIYINHASGGKSIYCLWLDEEKPVITQEYYGTLLIRNEDLPKLKELLLKLEKN